MLPNELMGHIFDSLSLTELAHVRLTCRDYATLVMMCESWYLRCLCIFDTLSIQTPRNIPTRNVTWQPLFLLLQRTEDSRQKLVPVSTFCTRWIARPFIVGILSVALSQTICIDLIRTVQRPIVHHHHYRLYFLTQVVECALCMMLLPTVLCYIFVTGLYAWHMQLPTTVDSSFHDLYKALQELRDVNTEIPTVVFDAVNHIISEAEQDVTARNDINWKVHMLTACPHYSTCLTIGVLIDLCLWLTGFQDQKVLMSKRYR